MKIAVVLILAGIGVLGRAEAEVDADSSTVRVCVQDGIGNPILKLNWAKTIASSMFARAGVRIVWQSSERDPHHTQPPIVLTLASNTPEKFPPNIYAYALVFEGVHIRIFVDHVIERAHHETTLATFLLAHVMVHEIAHILEGLNDHSPEGIMKATWTEADIKGMTVKPLSFTPGDIRLIRAGLAVRNPAKTQSLAARGPR